MFNFVSFAYPASPGCYLMRNARGTVIYVGKAKKLRHRLASYFQKRDRDWKTQALVREISNIEVILVNNEVESLVLENNLIKLYRPRYNRMLMRDDTGYKYIVLTAETTPRFVPFKKHWINKDLGEAHPDRRFGPYPNGSFRDSMLDYICDRFQLRTCNPLPKRVCLRYHLGTCSGICEGHIRHDRYQEAIQQALAFLKNPNVTALREMKDAMKSCADKLDFERAQRIKAQYEALKQVYALQIVERDVPINQDVLYFGSNMVLVMCCIQGILHSLNHYQLEPGETLADRHQAFIVDFYRESCPDEIITNGALDAADVQNHLRRIRGKKVPITYPQRGVKAKLLEMCRINHAYRMSLSEGQRAKL